MSAIKTLWRDHMTIAMELEDYAKRLRFSPSLHESAASTLLQSIHHGDGMLWSDSLLVNCLSNSVSRLRTLFDRFPGFRTSLIAQTEFVDTLSTSRLAIQPSFQTPISEAIRNTLRFEGGTLTEERVLEIELREALDEYAEEQHELAEFVSNASAPIFDMARAAVSDAAGDALRRMAFFLQDVTFLALRAGTHPFRALVRSQPANRSDGGGELSATSANDSRMPRYLSIAFSLTGDEFRRERRHFYWQLRDSARVPGDVLTDEDLTTLADAFREKTFENVCDSMDARGEGDADDRNPATSLREQFHFAAARLWACELPLSVLADRLAEWRARRHEEAWPLSHKVLLSVGEMTISAGYLDVSTPVTVGHDSNRTLGRVLANVGIWVPSAVWTDSVLDRFEHMLNRGADELAFQRLFEAYPDFILDELHVEAYPQVYMFEDSHARSLKPDFAVRRSGSRTIDLIELKHPSCKLLGGSTFRPTLTRAAARAVAQLHDYREWFRDPSNRRQFQDRHGLDGFEPRRTLVIGRRAPQVSPDVWSRATSTLDVDVLTYDDILEKARARRRWML